MRVLKPEKSIHFPSIEKFISEKWEEERTFAKSIEQRSQAPHYTFYDGPPFATGLPHFGHFVPGSLKDAIARYFTMKGFRVERRFGWDCHGVPVELLVQKELGLNGRLDIEAYGIDRFNQACRDSVMRYTGQWEEYVRRLGRWVDMDNDYRTMDLPFMESVWVVFKAMWDQDLIYEGQFVVSYSTALGTTLSNFEASLDYRDVQDPSLTIKAKLKSPGWDGQFLLVWTTTPWTLPANMAIAIDPEATYVKVRQQASGEIFCLLEARISAYGFENEAQYEILEKFPGQQLEGVAYEPFFPDWVAEGGANAFYIYGASFVLHDTGTGAVHMAPAFGEDDFQLAKKKNLPILDHLDAAGRYRVGNASNLVGLDFKAGDKLIIGSLKERGLVFRHDTFVHSYPHCYRSGTPLIYRAMGSWFVKVEQFRSQLLEVNEKIHWVPEHVKSGRFGKWLEGARDWNIGRSRYWGNPLPVWQNLETGERICLGSVADLQQYSEKPVTDLHMEFIDHIKIPSQKHPGTFLTRVPFVLDCWFESGSMPYAQKHYPFENKSEFEQSFPADFICEGLDQTRGWFYTLTLISTLLYKKEAFKNVIVNGLVLAEDGRKMSKSLKNYPDPIGTLDEFGADSVRLFLLGSPATNGEEVRFSVEGVKESTRRLLLPLWNAYNFFATYASVTTWDAERDFVKSTHQWDCWIDCRLQELLQAVEQQMNGYEVARIVPLIAKFFDDLNNWYIRRNRRRFWDESHEAFSTLYCVLQDVVKVLAPFAPFAAEYFFQKLRLDKSSQKSESVHLAMYPTVRSLVLQEEELLRDIALVQQVVELGRTVRVTHKLKNRQPLSSLTIGVLNEQSLVPLREFAPTILDELNVKTIHFTNRLQDLATIVVKPNFKTLGKRLGDKIKNVQKSLAQLDESCTLMALGGGSLQICGETLAPEDLTVELRPRSQSHLVAAREGLVVALDGTLTEELRHEGQARELVSFIQKARKELNFNVEQRIQGQLEILVPALKEAIEQNLAYIQEETLSQISFGPLPETAQVFEALEGSVRFSLMPPL